jgi:hypothetical protein
MTKGIDNRRMHSRVRIEQTGELHASSLCRDQEVPHGASNVQARPEVSTAREASQS